MKITQTKKSVVYTFDGFSPNYGAYVQGAFTGRFVVPKEHAHLVRAGYELWSLLELHRRRELRIVLRNAGNVQ